MVSKGGCVGWLKKRTNLEKTLLSLSSVLLLTLVLMILIGIVYSGKKTDGINEESVCWKNECIKTAGDVLSSMDTSTDACASQYDYACGEYGQEPEESLPASRRSTESVYFMLKRIMESGENLDIRGLDDVRSFYNSCVRFGSYRQDVAERRDSLLRLMSEVGVGIWPIIDPVYDDSLFSRELTLVSLTLLDVPVVFRMEMVPDENSDGSYLVKISPGGPRETGRSPSDIRNDVHLKSSVLTSFLLIGASSANTDSYDVISVDSSFAAIEQDKSAVCDDVVLLTPQEAVKEMNRLMPEIDWTVVMNAMRNATGLLRNFAVQLHCKQKIRDYAIHLDDLTKRSETNYLGWRFFSKFVEHVIPTFEKSQFGTDEVVPRWKVCLELMEKFASPVLVEVLKRKLVNKDIQEEVVRISNAALTSAQKLVSRARWLSDSQRSRIREKVARIRVRYPFQKGADSEFGAISVPQVDVRNFTSVVVHRQRQLVIQKFRELGRGSDTRGVAADSWSPLLSSKTDLPSTDFIAYVYFDKLRSPYMRRHGTKWMNYGGFGVAVAREISKVLMEINAESREGSTALWNVWSRSRNSSTCRVKYLAARQGRGEELLTPEVTEKLMKDIFLDQSSVEIAYETAVSSSAESHSLPGLDLTNEQIFFLSYAQTLCEADTPLHQEKYIPVKDRLNAAVSSFEAFNKVYNCAPSSSRCQIWA